MDSKVDKALKTFYENLAQSSEDFASYYYNPIGISRVIKILKLLALHPDQAVCDIGCGDGCIASQAKRITKKIKALDISSTRAKRAKLKGIDAICADAMSVPFKNGVFDRVICSEVIEHLSDPEPVLYEIRRILKRDGKVVVTVPLNEVLNNTLHDVPGNELMELTYEQIRIKYKVKNTHLRSFDEMSFQKLLTISGFELEKIDYTFDYHLRQNRVLRFMCKIWHFILGILGEKLTRIPLSISFIYFGCLLFYRRTQSKHHIIVRATPIL
jgi:ubiquinone/menaquinone biosynthesis C-methylase UbiE